MCLDLILTFVLIVIGGYVTWFAVIGCALRLSGIATICFLLRRKSKHIVPVS